MKIRTLTVRDRDALEQLIDEVEADLEYEDFWLPINQTSKDHFFDREWTVFFGMFEDSRLIAAVALFFNEHEYGESLKQLGQSLGTVAEIGRAMVHPAYRGNNLLYRLNTELLKAAKSKGIDTVLATIHPDNLPSQRSFQKLGLVKQCTYVKGDRYVRDIYTMKLH